MRAPRLSDERGIALAVAIFALVVIGALVAGTFFAGRLEQQAGSNTFYAAQAAEAAEAGLNDAVATQTAASMLPLAANEEVVLTTIPVGAHATASRTMRRLADNVFLVRSIGTRTDAAGGQLAGRTLGQLIRLVQLDIEIEAGLTALGDVKVTGGS
jgi:Tfp pilus assembly protein PilX